MPYPMERGNTVRGAKGGDSVNSEWYNRRVLMGVLSVTTTFSAKYQLTANFGWPLTFTFLQRILFRHNPSFLYFSSSITFVGGPC